jgi:hypothetical protein
MTEPLNLKLYRNSADAFAQSPRRYQATFTMLAVPLMFGLGFVAFRTRRMRPLWSAFAVLGLAHSAAQLLRSRSHELRDRHLDEAGEQSFPASDSPALR